MADNNFNKFSFIRVNFLLYSKPAHFLLIKNRSNETCMF